jgi:hypothetical protein
MTINIQHTSSDLPVHNISDSRTARLLSSKTSRYHRNPPQHRRACPLNRRSRASARRNPSRASEYQSPLGELRVRGLDLTSPRNCPWTLRRLVLAKPPVEVPKEVDNLGISVKVDLLLAVIHHPRQPTQKR